MQEKNSTKFTIVISALSAEGHGIGKLPDGKVIFVPFTAPGDEVLVHIKKNKKNYAEAEITEIVKASDKRIVPVCKHFGLCGGCKLQHISYEEQLHIKTQTVRDAFERIGKVDVGQMLPIVGCNDIYNYRNKLEFTATNRKWLTEKEIETNSVYDRRGIGFHVPGNFLGVIDIEHCHLNERSNTIRKTIKTFAIENNFDFFNIKEKSGLLRNVLIRTTSSGELLVLVSFFNNDEARIERMMSYLTNTFPEITSLQYVINPKMNDTIYDLEPIVVKGNSYITEKLGKYSFQIGPKSFFQTNTKQAERLYEITKSFAGLTGTENVFDLYTGVGSIAIYLSDACKQVVGIEQIEAAICDAKINAKLNNISNAHFYTGDVRLMMNDALISKHGLPDVVITDPPRAGMHEDVIKTILKAKPPRLIYVSCNAATQARDASLLCEKYMITKMQPVDMFPQTMHIENVACFELR